MRTQVTILAIAALSLALGGMACSAKESRDSLQETPASPVVPAAPATQDPVPTQAAQVTPTASAGFPEALFVPAFWRLTELLGQPIPRKVGGEQDLSLVFVKESNTVSGFAGCNTFGGGFDYGPGDRLRFTNVFSTQMACESMAVETEFLEALDKTDSFHVADGVLTLHRARMAPLAKFEAVADVKQ